MEVGSYAHRAILHEPEEIPSIEQSKLSPDRDAVHRGRLRPAARAGAGADARAARRRRRGDPLRDQRPAVADLRRQPDPRREPGQGSVDRVGGLDQGGPGRRPRGRRVDDAGSLGDRHPPQRHRALLPAPDAARAHATAHHRVVHQDLRDHPPRGAVRVRPRAAALAHERRAEEAGRGVLRGRRLGAAAVVRVQRRPARGVRRRRDAARARVGLALVEPDHQRRAPAHARGGRRDRPDRVRRSSTSPARVRSTPCSAPASRSATSRSAR